MGSAIHFILVYNVTFFFVGIIAATAFSQEHCVIVVRCDSVDCATILGKLARIAGVEKQ